MIFLSYLLLKYLILALKSQINTVAPTTVHIISCKNYKKTGFP